MSMFDCPHCGDTHHVNDFCATGPMSSQPETPMTHPLTPREKPLEQVAYEGWAQGLPGCEWGNQTETQKRAWSKATDATLTALASGSGDHAELAGSLRESTALMATTASVRMDVWQDHSTQVLRAADALEALLAENAALRGERDRAKERMHKAIDKARDEEIAAQNAELRATEAERKLAEAVGIASKLSAAISWLDYPFIDNNTSEDELRSRVGFMMKDAEQPRAILSKEAERG